MGCSQSKRQNTQRLDWRLMNAKEKMNKTEFKSMKGAVGMRLEEKGVFKRLEDEIASLATRIPNLEKKTRLVIKHLMKVERLLANSMGPDQTAWMQIRTGICGVYESDDGGIAFSANLSMNTSFKSDEALLFDEVLINDGGGFNQCTGEFTVPVSGKYLISATIRAQYHKQVSAEVVCNEKMLGRITSGYGGIDKAASSITVAVEVRRGDVIYVKQATDRSGDYHGNGYTTFSGLLFD